MSKPIHERRKQARFAIASDVDLTSGDNFYLGHARDISVGGLFIETSATLPMGSKIAVRLKIKGKTFSLDAEVAWVLYRDDDQEGGIGVRFIGLPVEARRLIESFMAVRPPLSFDIGPPSAAPPAQSVPPSLPAPRGPPPLPLE